EIFTGFLAKRHYKAHRSAHLEGFRAMNEALVAQAVKIWTDRGGTAPGPA
ncbi:MAG: hypothetical protein IM661_00030, partial [Phenylobacterium sp.]|nr:hypothetical protein [Phenylobacterium sp.]